MKRSVVAFVIIVLILASALGLALVFGPTALRASPTATTTTQPTVTATSAQLTATTTSTPPPTIPVTISAARIYSTCQSACANVTITNGSPISISGSLLGVANDTSNHVVVTTNTPISLAASATVTISQGFVGSKPYLVCRYVYDFVVVASDGRTLSNHFSPPPCSANTGEITIGTPTMIATGQFPVVGVNITDTTLWHLVVIVFAVARNASGQTVWNATSTVIADPLSSVTAYFALVNFPCGNYDVKFYAVLPGGSYVSAVYSSVLKGC